MSKINTILIVLWFVLLGIVIAMLLSIGGPQTTQVITPAAASTTAPGTYDRTPYGGCDEAWQAPKSEGAKWCARQAKRNKRFAEGSAALKPYLPKP